MKNRRKPTYIVRFWRPVYDDGPTHVLAATFNCGTSLENARRFAERLLAPYKQERTRWSRVPHTEDYGADISLEGSDRPLEIVECPWDLVPSVGELGWTP